MIKNYYTRSRDFFTSEVWKDTKEKYLEEKCHLCELCAKEKNLVLATDVYLTISPRRYDLSDPDLVVDPANLIAVCAMHRNALHRLERQRREAGHV